MITRSFNAEVQVKPGYAVIPGANEQGVTIGAGVPIGLYDVESMPVAKEIGEQVPVTLLGPAKAVAGAAITAGGWLKANASGALIPVGTVAGRFDCVGYALENAATGEYFDVFVQKTSVTIPA